MLSELIGRTPVEIYVARLSSLKTRIAIFAALMGRGGDGVRDDIIGLRT